MALACPQTDEVGGHLIDENAYASGFADDRSHEGEQGMVRFNRRGRFGRWNVGLGYYGGRRRTAGRRENRSKGSYQAWARIQVENLSLKDVRYA